MTRMAHSHAPLAATLSAFTLGASTAMCSEEREHADDLAEWLLLEIYPGCGFAALLCRRLRTEWFVEKHVSVLIWNFNF